VEPTLMVVGLNYRTAPMAVRERFWIPEKGRYEALFQLSGAEGIDEVVVLSTCNRTEFFLWANDVTLAANSVMRLLGAEYGLKLCECKHFYRLLDESALLHIFRLASCLDSLVLGAPQIISQIEAAWQQAQRVGASGRFLDAVLQKAIAVSERVRREMAIGQPSVSMPSTAVEFARQFFGTLQDKKIVLIGAGEMCELAARDWLNQGGNSAHMTIVNRTFDNAVELAAKLGAAAIPFEERIEHMADADVIVSSTSCPHTILRREEVEAITITHEDKPRSPDEPLLIVDLAMPRDVDSSVSTIKGVFLCDLDDLEGVINPGAKEREGAAAEANKILQAEAQGFRRHLMAERAVPTVVALRSRLDEFCRQELDAFRREIGPISKDQDEMLNAVMSRMTQRLAGSLARELRELPEKGEQEQLTTALHRLFHLPAPQAAIAGTRY
jgi:glutamyl-tRNA reductase